MMPGKDIKDKNLSPSAASPPPSLQSIRRKSRGEQINFRLPVDLSSQISIRKRKKNWRSPSNPLDFNMNCELVAKVAGMRIESKDSIKNLTMISSTTTTTTNIPSNIISTPGSPCQSTQKGQQQLNFYNKPTNSTLRSSNSKDFKESEMTVIKPAEKLLGERTTEKSCPGRLLNSYETMLLRGPKTTDNKFKMIAELSISPIISTGSSDYTSTRRHVFTFESSFCRADSSTNSSFDSTSLAYGHIDPNQPPPPQPPDLSSKKWVTFSRCSLLQVILRNPQDNSVAGIFVVKLELSDMPAESKTILRQKAYKSKCLKDDGDGIDTATDYLAKFIEIPLKRSYDPEAKRQKIHLAGPIRVAFSFNRSNLRYTSPRKSDATAVEPNQKTRTVLQFPCKDQKYFPLITDKTPTTSITNHDRLRSHSLTTENTTRSFQHGSLCI